MTSLPQLLLAFPTIADSSPDAATGGIFAVFAFFWVIFCIAMLILSLVINWKIAQKAGFEGVTSLLMFIPLVGIIVLCYFAFTEWPIERALREAKARIPRA